MSRAQPFGQYLLHERVNVGGMAEVFRATDRRTGRIVAVKRLLPSLSDDAEFIAMFRDEAGLASQLDHPNVARIHELGREAGRHYIAMEYVAGKDARALFDRVEVAGKRVPLDVTLGIVSQAAAGLAHAHGARDASGTPLSIVHRDVSLQNLLIGFDGTVKLIDFGIAKAAGIQSRTQAGTIKGKFSYMSPEQVRGQTVDQRTDIFSLGVCFWELVTGQRLFQAPTDVGVIEKVRLCAIKRPIEVVSVPPEIDRMVMNALAKDASGRYSFASKLFADLDAFAQQGGLVADQERIACSCVRRFPRTRI